jgi:ribosomal protein L37AE/L43A
MTGLSLTSHMPEYCPHCNQPVDSVRRESDEGPVQELWQCKNCEKEWRHPEETVLNRELDFSKNNQQISRRNSDTNLTW